MLTKINNPRLMLTSVAASLLLLGCTATPVATDGVKSLAQLETVDSNTVNIKPDPSLPPLPIEKTGKIEVLPAKYPESWMFVDEVSFQSQFGGKMIILDVAEPKQSKLIKGTADKNLVGNFANSKTRPEFYILESFHERGSRGPRIDLLVIYDKVTLSPIKEIVLTHTRLTALPRRDSMTLSADEKFLYIANFSPAASFTVFDLDSREVVDTIGTPGCVLPFPTGERSITSICSNGSLLTTVLDNNGKKASQHRVAPFFDTDKTPIFERPSYIDGIGYFPSFAGEMHEIDLSNEVAQYKGKWSLISEEERTAGWRPGGMTLSDSDEQGLLYIIMNEAGFDGSQTHGGNQIWVFDVKSRTRIAKFDAPNWAVSVAVTRGKKPLVVVTNGEMNLDIIDPITGKFIRTLSDFGNVTPIVLFKAY
ncbi:amine dehydrogenase large subunit [Paraglaciecola arctica]|mgnify:CR=1 FL=1|uniref:Methylamine dehydrogenase heavy chain n=1 Tax=Paraglaciecola arctica BSs20135 TaxID=493475 RepID=K6Z5K0_9ALTE|nr:amine dehydrogenase large subunit [Paraglaciecola arctica]GAC18715.1 methylamine dehydrogenase heavy chain [Paraglaciecola arctica BSs20135]